WYLRCRPRSAGGRPSPPFSIPLRNPAHATHVQPFAGGRAFLLLGAEPQYVAVRILHLHLERPRIVRGCVANRNAAREKIGVERLRVAHADPDPATGMALVSFAQEKPDAAAPDRGESGFLPFDGEPERRDV